MKRVYQLGSTFVLAALLAACSTGEPAPAPIESPAALEATAAPTTAPAATSAPSSTAAATPTSMPLTETPPAATATALPAATSGPAASASVTLTVTMDEMRFQPAELRVPAGETVRLDLQNPDRLEHSLVIADAGFAEALAPGASRAVDLAVALPPGSYAFFCSIVDEEGSHQANGMEGTLVVEAVP
ncbi:MAG: cupredoxin domain-containing protein [Anaerolineales bacterium]|nr:cupredoxin domain-containing protein [Anaerolineales bacterium]